MADNQVATIPSMPATAQVDTKSMQDSVASLLAPFTNQISSPMPDPYVLGREVAQPRMPVRIPFTPMEKEAPINNQATSIRRARTQNSVADLVNMIGGAAQKIQAKKDQLLKDDLLDVMRSKQNVANAEAVMGMSGATDEQKAMAKQVIEKSKKQLETILNDPKKAKMLQKALDVSFVDPEKNKTPEVQAFQAAHKEFKEAGPYNANNPIEAQVAQLAANPQAAMQDKSAHLTAPNAPQVTQAPSTTPRADAVLAKDSTALAPNPQYAEAIKQRDAAQKQFAAILPRVIDSQIKAEIANVKDQNSNARAAYTAGMKLATDIQNNIAKLQIANTNASARIKEASMRAAATITSAKLRADAIKEVSKNKMLSEEQKATAKAAGVQDIDKRINSLEAAMKSYGPRYQDIQNNKTMTEQQKTEALKMIDAAHLKDIQTLQAMQDIRSQYYPDADPLPVVPPAPESAGFLDRIGKVLGKVPLGIFGITPSSTNSNGASSDGNKHSVQQVGEQQSDETSSYINFLSDSNSGGDSSESDEDNF